MADARYGYRDDDLFGEHMCDPVAVCVHEMRELGNVDVARHLLESHSDALTQEQRDTLARICSYPAQGFDATDEDELQFRDILVQVLDGRDFCKWLVDVPANIFFAYIEPFDGADATLAEAQCWRYAIPEGAIALTEEGAFDGTLWAWKADRDNTDPVDITPLSALVER